MPPMRPVCVLRHVQHQRGAVSGLRPLGERIPCVLPPLRHQAERPGRLLLPHLRGAAAGGRHRGRGGKDRLTEYDLETTKAWRRVSLLEYGFGPETLRGRKICPACGRGNGAYRTDCISCGAALPKETLYDFYRARHRCCPGCGVVVTDVAVYCPECGTRLSKETGAKGASG